MKKVHIALIFLMVCLTSCIQMLDGAAKAVTESAQQNTESLSASAYKTITVDSLYSLDVPNYMKELSNLNPEASLNYANIYKEAYTIVIHENKQEFIETFTSFDEYNSAISAVENYALAQKRMLQESLENFKFQDYGLVTLNGYPARQVKIFGEFDGIKASYLIAFIEGPENMYMIMNWTVGDRMKSLDNTFEYTNGTFKLLKT